MLVNDNGLSISGIKEFSKPEYQNDNGNPNWDLLQDADSKGFYKKARYSNGKHTKMTVLPVNSLLIRYGDVAGRFVADDGTPYEKLSLPYKKETVEFHRYRVIRPFSVEEGYVAPGFDNNDCNELAIQYFSEKSINDLIDIYIAEDLTWVDELKQQKK